MSKNLFDRIALKQIEVFCEILLETNTRTVEFLKARFSNDARNFDDTLDFLLQMQCLSVEGISVVLHSEFEELLAILKSTTDKGSMTREFFTRRLITGNSSLSVEARDFLIEFHFETETWSFLPTNTQKLRFSGIRNLLMDFDTLDVDEATGKYKIIDTRFLASAHNFPQRKLTRRDFHRIIAEREQLGREAELAIMGYEKERLKLSPIPLIEIEHTADTYINAGYDIKSLEEQLDDFGKPVPRYIEVKAVSALDYLFHWSKNEMEVAKKYSDKYILYLLPVKSSKEFYIDLLKTVRDPMNNLFHTKEWTCWEDALSFCLVSANTLPLENRNLDC